jgi:heme-degrading monooxygenase HmoA
MVRHIVLWRLKSPDEWDFARIRTALERQLGRVPGLLHVEVGRFASGRRAVDFALVCDFESREALAAYHRHAAHQETRAVVDPLVTEHWIADYPL